MKFAASWKVQETSETKKVSESASKNTNAKNKRMTTTT